MSIDEKKKLIRASFPALDQSELVDALLSTSKVLTVEKGTQLLDVGTYIKLIPLVIEGSIKVFREDESGREIFLYYILPGQSCAMSMTSCQRMERSHIRAVAQETTQLLGVSVEQLYEWNKKYQSWRNFVAETYSKRFEEVLQVLEGVVFHRMDYRLMQYLEDKARILNTSTLKISHQEIAGDLATSREVISRLLKQLEQKGMVELGRGEIEILV